MLLVLLLPAASAIHSGHVSVVPRFNRPPEDGSFESNERRKRNANLLKVLTVEELAGKRLACGN